MRHPSDGVACDRSSTLRSVSVSQGLHLGVPEPRDSSPKVLRKFDFRSMTPSTIGTFHRRGLGMPSSVTQTNESLMACGKKCVLSLRPERCGNKAENEKSEESEESEKGSSTASKIVDGLGKTGEGKKRAQSSVARTRATATSEPRPSTAPANTRPGRSDPNPLTPDTPGYRTVWRPSETLDGISTGNPVLCLYLPNYQADPRREVDEVLDVEADRQGADTERKIGEIRIRGQLDVLNDENRNGDCTGSNRPRDVAEDVMATETGGERTHTMEEDGERRQGSQNEQVEKEENERHGVSCDITQEPSEERSTVEEEDGRLGKSDDPRQPASAAHRSVLEERKKAQTMKQKCRGAHVGNSESNSTRRLTLPAPALSFPGTLARTHSSPSLCVLPSFYSSSFGLRIRTPHTPRRHRAKTRVGFDQRGVKPASERPPSLERRGSRHILKIEPGGITGPRPKLMSSEFWGSLPRKTKTTKTFVWGPLGPQETKSVCELHTRTSKWRGLDWCRGLGEHGPSKMLVLS